MRALIQRAASGAVTVNGQTVGQIDQGLVILVGVTHDDTDQDAAWLAAKIAHLRIFEDADGRMNRSLLDVQGAALIVSQFTLYGDARRGRRPSYTEAARPDMAEPMIERFADMLRSEGIEQVESGVFGAHMMVQITNDGPVTLWLDTHEIHRPAR